MKRKPNQTHLRADRHSQFSWGICEKSSSSKASLRLKEIENAFSVAFRGGLEKATLDDLLQDNQILTGRIEGDLEMKLFMDHPLESKATGPLKAEGLSLPLPPDIPVTLEDFSLHAQDSQMTIERARLVWEEGEVVLGGMSPFPQRDLFST